MTNIDEKLKAIIKPLPDFAGDIDDYALDRAIPTDQAFIEAGIEEYEEVPTAAVLRKRLVEHTKAVLQEEGYVKPDFAPFYVSMIDAYLKAGGDADCILMSRTDWDRNRKLAGVMTGQEWFDRFERELRPHMHTFNSGNGYAMTSDVMTAAKRAAGIAE